MQQDPGQRSQLILPAENSAWLRAGSAAPSEDGKGITGVGRHGYREGAKQGLKK